MYEMENTKRADFIEDYWNGDHMELMDYHRAQGVLDMWSGREAIKARKERSRRRRLQLVGSESTRRATRPQGPADTHPEPPTGPAQVFELFGHTPGNS